MARDKWRLTLKLFPELVGTFVSKDAIPFLISFVKVLYILSMSVMCSCYSYVNYFIGNDICIALYSR